MKSKYIAIDLKKANEQPFSDLYHTFNALESIHNQIGVLNTHLNNLIKWNKDANSQNARKIIYELNNLSLIERSEDIKRLSDSIYRQLPHKEFKR